KLPMKLDTVTPRTSPTPSENSTASHQAICDNSPISYTSSTDYIMSNKKKECPGCAMMVDQDANVCPICGYEFPKQSKTMQVMVWIMIFLLIIYWVLW